MAVFDLLHVVFFAVGFALFAGRFTAAAAGAGRELAAGAWDVFGSFTFAGFSGAIFAQGETIAWRVFAAFGAQAGGSAAFPEVVIVNPLPLRCNCSLFPRAAFEEAIGAV